MAKRRIKLKHIKIVFLVASMFWILLWAVGFLPIWQTYLNSNPNTPIWVAYLIHEIPFFASFFAVAWIVTTELKFTLRFALAEFFIFSAAVGIAMPPLCVGLDGVLLVSTQNHSCLAGTDSLVASFWSPIVPFGNPLLFYLTYVGGFLIFLAIGVWLIKSKDLKEDLRRGIPL
jgi:hypothetical protein